MKYKILTIALITMLSFSTIGCTTESNTVAPTQGEDKFVSKNEQTKNLTETKEHAMSIQRFGNIASPSDINAEVTVAANSLAEYVDVALYDPYFSSRWWELKDDFDAKGLTKIKDLTTVAFYEKLQSQLSESDFDTLKTEVLIPETPSPYEVQESCFESWEEGSCIKEGQQDEQITFVSEKNGVITLNYKTSFVRFLASDTGGTAEQNIIYSANFELKNIGKTSIIYKVDNISNASIAFGEPTLNVF